MFSGPKKKVIILGSGWGALSVLNHLTPGQFDVTVVSPRNYFLFTPLLPSVTVGTVEARSIVEPLRKLIQKVHGGGDCGIEFLESECVDINPTLRMVHCEDRSGVVGAVSAVDVSVLNYDVVHDCVLEYLIKHWMPHNYYQTPSSIQTMVPQSMSKKLQVSINFSTLLTASKSLVGTIFHRLCMAHISGTCSTVAAHFPR